MEKTKREEYMIIAIMYAEDGGLITTDWNDPRVTESGATVDLQNELWSSCGSSMEQHKFGEMSVCNQTSKKGVLLVLDTCTDFIMDHIQTLLDVASSFKSGDR